MFSEQVQSRAEKRDSTRARVLSTAEQLFRDAGFEATTIRRIAAAAHVSNGTVIAVGDKDTLLVTVYDEWISAIHRDRKFAVIDSAGPLAADEAPAAVLGLFTPFIEHFARDPALSRAYAAIIVTGRIRSAIFQQLRQALVAEIQAILERSGLTPDRAIRGAYVIYFSYLGMLMSAGGQTATEASDIGHFLDIIDFVTTSPSQEE